jgi:hypothetical protein
MISGVLLALHDRKVRRDISAIGVAVAAAAEEGERRLACARF